MPSWFDLTIGRCLCLAALVATLAADVAVAADTTFSADIVPILRARCEACHNREEKSGNVDFAALAGDRSAARSRKLWRKAIAQVEAGAMPPADADPLTAAEKERLLAWMKRAVVYIDPKDPANRDPGPAPVRRLTLAEYNNTVRDLLGFEFDAAAVGMTDDFAEGNPFGNLALALEMPPALLEKYFAAADQILDRLFGVELRSNIEGRIQDQARLSREQLFGLKAGEWRSADYQVSPPAGVDPRTAAQQLIAPFAHRAYRGQATPGDVDRLLVLFDRAQSQGQSYGDSIRVMLKGILVSPKFLYRLEHDAPGQRRGEVVPVADQQLAVRLAYFLWASMPDDELLELAAAGKLTAAGPSNELVKFAGKVISAPGSERHQGNNREKVFDGDLATQLEGPDHESYWIGLDLGAPQPLEQVRFAGRSGQERRLVGGKFQASSQADFSDDVVDLWEVKSNPASGWNTQAIHEPSTSEPVTRRYVRYVPAKNSYGNIAEFEVRGRSAGTVLEQQVRRMLADRRARALTDQFAVHWLQIQKLPTARPSTEFFPEFNSNIRQAMFAETTTFFDYLRREDRSLLDLLQADYTFVNEDLARYYGLPAVTGKELRRVSLRPEDRRGGLLGMGSVLAVTSHTSRTSPTLRGKWILEVIFGAPPPPPPANVSQIKEETGRGKKQVETFREKLAQHAHDKSCAGCHRKMDPLGFALDNFDAVGRWRDKLGDLPLDTTGELPTGEKLTGVDDLKRVIVARQDDFTRNLTEQLLTYALGRELTDSDDCHVQQIVSQWKADDHRFSALILEIVKSVPFRHRRGTAQLTAQP